jgi:hypothetical protein
VGWEAQLAKLNDYKAEHGDCIVPRDWAEDRQLGIWVHNQRANKKHLDCSEPSKGMTAVRAAKLEALGFAWHAPPHGGIRNDVGWEAQLAKLKAYKAEHGDCNVPWTKDPRAYLDALTLSRTEPLSVTDGLCRVGCASLSGGREEVRPPIALSWSHALTLPCSHALTR